MTMPGSVPHVRVLLATYEGERWLGEQLASLVQQQGVRVSVVASDDASTDSTRALLEAAAARDDDFSVLPDAAHRFGNAHRNFMRLIRDTPLDDADFFALCDQDDLWLPHKLARAVDRLRDGAFQAYSANCTAFWPDGRRKLLVKSQPQRRWDHLFESAGPGCSFVFTRAAFVELQRWVTTHREPLDAIKVHDWLIYAYAREHRWHWVIDDASVLLYRQHERNELGANAGWRGAFARFLNLGQGRFRRDALAIGAVVGAGAKVLRRLERMRLTDRLWLALHARQFRRSAKEAFYLLLALLVMRRR
jgi:rhamnosyltransferase